MMNRNNSTLYDRARNSRRPGMTLLELMIGIVVMGAAVAAGYATFATVVDQKHRMERLVDDASRGATVRRQLTNWVQSSMMLSFADASNDGQIDVGSRDQRDELKLYTAAENPLHGGGAQMILTVNTSDPRYQRGLIAYFTPVGAPTGDRADTVAVVLDSMVTGISIEFMRRMQGIEEWIPSSEWMQAMGRPVAARIYLQANDPRDLTPLLHLPITIRMLGIT